MSCLTIRPIFADFRIHWAALVTAFVYRAPLRAHIRYYFNSRWGRNKCDRGMAIGGIYISDDQQLRDLTFWSMGGLGQTDWPSCLVAIICILAAGVGLFSIAKSLVIPTRRGQLSAGVDVRKN